MIHRLEIENFYSIRETQVIDLRIGAKVPDEESRFGSQLDGSNVRVPKTAAFFGANASGKSNVLKVVAFLGWFLTASFDLPPDAPLPVARFADGNEEPLRINILFDWFADLAVSDPESLRNAQYTYEVMIGNAGGRSKVVLSEELRVQPAAGKSRSIFKRDASGEVQSGSSFSLKGLSHVLTALRPNVSTTSTMTKYAGRSPIAGLYTWAKRLHSNIPILGDAQDERNAIQYYAENQHVIRILNSALGQLDTGIQFMHLIPTAEGIQPAFTHYGLKDSLSLQAQSEGTRQFFRIYPTIWQALETGGVAVVDELDSTIHPMIIPAILRWFHNPAVNARQAQLWMSGHSASLLEELKKEEIFFTEKDQGRTKVYGLTDIDSVRRSDNFYQKYLGGVYGAVPRIG